MKIPEKNKFSLRERLHEYRPKGSRYIHRMLLDDEFIVHVARLHWTIYGTGLSILLIGTLIGHYGNDLTAFFVSAETMRFMEMPIAVISVFCVLVGSLNLFFTFLRDISTELVVTNERVIHKFGFIATRVYEAGITKISSVDIEQTIAGRMLDYGTVTVRSSGQDLKPVDHVSDPYRYYFYVMREARLEAHPEKEEALTTDKKKQEKLFPPATERIATSSTASTPKASNGNNEEDND